MIQDSLLHLKKINKNKSKLKFKNNNNKLMIRILDILL